jgi:hypothetical protein
MERVGGLLVLSRAPLRPRFPFLAGGLTRDGGDAFPAILLGLGLGFMSTSVLVLTSLM